MAATVVQEHEHGDVILETQCKKQKKRKAKKRKRKSLRQREPPKAAARS